MTRCATHLAQFEKVFSSDGRIVTEQVDHNVTRGGFNQYTHVVLKYPVDESERQRTQSRDKAPKRNLIESRRTLK